MWQLAAVHMKMNVGSDEWNLKSSIESFTFLISHNGCKGNTFDSQIKHCCFMHYSKSDCTLPLKQTALVSGWIIHPEHWHVSLYSPDCTSLVSLKCKQKQKGGCNGKIWDFTVKIWLPVQQFYTMYFFFRLETILEFVFSLLVSVTYSNKRWWVDVESVFWINMLLLKKCDC